MKKAYLWMLSAILTVGGTSVFTSCGSDDDTPAVEKSEAVQNRDAFIEHTRATVKAMAENLNFESWETANNFNLYFNQYVLNNKDFESSLAWSIIQMMAGSVKDAEEGSDLAAQGVTRYIDFDLANFKYRFTMSDNNKDFDSEPADELEIILNGYNPQTKQVESGIYKVALKMVGVGQKRVIRIKGDEDLAVVLTLPDELQFALGSKVSGSWHNDFTGTISYKLPEGAVDNSKGFTAEAKINSDILATEGKKGDKTQLTLNITSDREKGKAEVLSSWTQNDRKMLELSLKESGENMGGISNLDMSQFESSSSIFEVIGSILGTRSIDEAKVTLLDDLTCTFSISNLQKLLEVENQYRTDGRNYADKQTIDEYTKKLNELVKAEMYCKGTNQTIPMRLTTTPVGIDYWAIYELDFGENEYVNLLAMLDRKTFAYVLNIVDHATDHAQQSAIVVRQLLEFALQFHDKLDKLAESLEGND